MATLRFGAAILAAALVAAACGSSGTPAPSGGSAGSPGAGGSPAASAAGSPAASGGGSGTACAVAPSGTAAAAKVTIRDFSFSPGTVTVKPGEAVSWTNEDSATHTATAVDGGCDSGRIAKGQTVTLVFPTAGTYRYHCTIHASMPEATVEVAP